MSLTSRTIVALLVGSVLAGCSTPTEPLHVIPSPTKKADQSIWSIEDAAEQRPRVSISVEVTPNTFVLGDGDITVVAMGIYLTNHEDGPVTLTSARVMLTIRPIHGAPRDLDFGPRTISLAARRHHYIPRFEDRGPHDLRHTAALRMRRHGLSESDIMEACGWETREMFKRYSIKNEKGLRERFRRAMAQRAPEIA